jgi:mannose-6-phosphate isomerase-like protein (cupin superfamily)
MPRRDGLKEGTLVHIDEVKPANGGWAGAELRVPIGRENGSDNMLVWAKLAPGAAQKKRRNDRSEMVYYVIRGRGLAGAGPDRAEVRAGHVHLIPRGVEHFLCNLSAAEPLEIIAVYTGAGSLEEAGYVATGDVSEADKRERTA